MQIEVKAPKRPKGVTREKAQRRSYAQLQTFLSAHVGDWLKVTPEDIAGDTLPRKQAILYHLARDKPYRIQTQLEDGNLFVRAIARSSEADHA